MQPSPNSPGPSWLQKHLLSFDRTVLRNPWLPHRPTHKQALFLLHSQVREVLYGGAAGGGKTDALLMGALQYVDTPGYSALLLMKTYKDLSLPKAGMARAREWLLGTRARWNGETYTWHFPSGATLTFGYLDHEGDEQRYRTAEFQYVAFDELTRFREEPYRFLFSRLRRLSGSEVPVRMRAATNPGGKGHEFVKRRFLTEDFLREKAASRFERTWWKEGRLFIPARLEDNPHLDRDDYESSLAELLPVAHAQLRGGDWSAHAGGHFQQTWFRSYRDNIDAWYLEPHGEIWLKRQCPIIIAGDPAGGVGESADFTAFVVCAITPNGRVLVLDVVRDRIAVEGIVPRLAELCQQWRPLYVILEDAFAQSAYIRQARGTLGIPAVRPMSPRGRSKLVRATPAIIRARNGEIYLPHRAGWLEDFTAELCAFTGDDTLDAHDDQVDALAYIVLAVQEWGVGGDDTPVVLGRPRAR